MPAPSITRWNGQIKTPWRGGYTSLAQLTENSRECEAEMDGCVYQLIWKDDNLMSFQFIRPFTMTLVTAWELYNPDGTLYRDLTPEVDKLTYFATNLASGAAVQYVSYLGTPLDELLDPGTYYMRITTGGVTYYWEPIKIVCKTFGVNVFPEDSFDLGLSSTLNNPDALWNVYDWSLALDGTKNTAGAPTDPALEFEGSAVANFGDGLIYRYLSGVWVSGAPPASIGWFDRSTGQWYQTNGTAWSGMVNAPVTVTDNGACWRGTANVPLYVNIGSMGCSEVVARVTIVVSGMTTGSVEIEVPDTGELVGITEDGTYSFTSYVANGYLLSVAPSSGFDGCITEVELQCSADISDCFIRLDWSNCGNIGNTYLAGGFTNSMYFDQRVFPVRPEVKTTVRTQQRADGSLAPTSRTRETRWQMGPFLAPWYVADALADANMYDHVEMRPVGGGADVLSNVEVTVENEEDFSECWKTVTITFENERAAVACCDDFAPPCKETCIDAGGFTDFHDPVESTAYLLAGSSEYAFYNGAGFNTPALCSSGLANIMTEDDLSVLERTVYFDLNTGVWTDIAIIGTVTPAPDGDGGCTLNVLAVIPNGYAAVLQYMNTDGDWITDETYALTAAEWLSNTVQRVTPADQDPVNAMRLMVYVDGIGSDGRPQSGRCIIGYSPEFSYECA